MSNGCVQIKKKSKRTLIFGRMVVHKGRTNEQTSKLMTSLIFGPMVVRKERTNERGSYILSNGSVQIKEINQ